MQGAQCSRRLLAANDYMLVEQCTCGSVHVTIGAVTLRLAGSAIPALATTLGEAARALVFRDVFAANSPANEVLS